MGKRFNGVLSIEHSSAAFIRIRANALLGAADYRRFEPQFADALGRRETPVPLLLDLRGFRGWTPVGFVHDLSWDLRNRGSFSRIAVVGDARWHEWITLLGQPLFRARMRFFRGETDAIFWLKRQVSARS